MPNPDIANSEPMTNHYHFPSAIEFSSDSLQILKTTLLAQAPFESCALLLGKGKGTEDLKNSTTWKIQLIWPCCNIWGEKIAELNDFSNDISIGNIKKGNKSNRFLIDPREQIIAQKWARKKNWRILGSAHSHPHSDATPSSVDLALSFNPSLMVIIDKFGSINAWWIETKKKYKQVKVAISQSIEEDDER